MRRPYTGGFSAIILDLGSYPLVGLTPKHGDKATVRRVYTQLLRLSDREDSMGFVDNQDE